MFLRNVIFYREVGRTVSFSLREILKNVPVRREDVLRWCTNEVQPSIETLYEIPKFFKMDVRELLVGVREVIKKLMSIYSTCRVKRNL